MLRADGQPDGVGLDALIQQLRLGQLAVGRGGRVDDQTLDVRDVGEQGEDLQIVDELMGLGLAALDLKGEDGAGSVGEVSIVELLLMPAGQGGMVHLRHLGVMVQIIHHL